MTQHIADFLVERLSPRGVGVVITARHLCQEMRGVKKTDIETTTSALHGLMKDDNKAREEFLALAHKF
jgi:GTP cyclohydrolase I